MLLSLLYSLQQIVDLDEKNQILTSNIWLNLDWKDHSLVWNSSEYGGVKVRITEIKVRVNVKIKVGVNVKIKATVNIKIKVMVNVKIKVMVNVKIKVMVYVKVKVKVNFW